MSRGGLLKTIDQPLPAPASQKRLNKQHSHLTTDRPVSRTLVSCNTEPSPMQSNNRPMGRTSRQTVLNTASCMLKFTGLGVGGRFRDFRELTPEHQLPADKIVQEYKRFRKRCPSNRREKYHCYLLVSFVDVLLRDQQKDHIRHTRTLKRHCKEWRSKNHNSSMAMWSAHGGLKTAQLIAKTSGEI